MLEIYMPQRDKWQAQAQERVRRAERRHKNPEGFDTDVVCMGSLENQDAPCDILPEWHIEQLDGTCFFACRRHGIEALKHAKPVPFVDNEWINKN